LINRQLDLWVIKNHIGVKNLKIGKSALFQILAILPRIISFSSRHWLWQTTVADYRQAIALQPDFVEAHYNLGVMLQEQGEREEAIACYQKALEIQPALNQK
jgi:tetratricopeptide (TPR) repeat protein